MKKKIHIIGGGLAGCELAYQLSLNNIFTHLYEMRPKVKTDAHQTGHLSELVCSNSFRSDDSVYNAVGLLHEELRLSNSLIMEAADKNKVPAGSALAVDRDMFSKYIDTKIKSNKYIKVINKEITSLKIFNDDIVVIATGPLTSKKLSEEIEKLTSKKSLDFFDAIAPIVYFESIDMSIAWKQSRYDKGDGDDYINCPLTKSEYFQLIENIKNSPKTEFKDFENTPFFESCLPIEEMIRRGPETLRYGPLKPVGLTNKHLNEKPYAVVQLRQDNKLGTLYNIVGFQTKMTYRAQKNVFKNIPGLQNAKFARFGGLHRNTFIKSPKVLDKYLRLKTNKNIFFAGQITGVEGYVESTAIGNLLARILSSIILNKKFISAPKSTAHGSLHKHITKNANVNTFQPMNINFGIIDSFNENIKVKGRERKALKTRKAIKDFKNWIKKQTN